MTGLLIHEWLAPAGGAENVVEQLIRTFPDADLRVLWNDAPERFGNGVAETWISRTPLRRSKLAALPLLPPTWRALRGTREYDWMLVSSHLFAHHARLRNQPHLPKLVYAHTPARYIWAPDHDGRGQSVAAQLASRGLKPLDRRRASEARAVATNSEFTRQRIQASWDRDATVIYPPVETERIATVNDWRSRLGKSELGQLAALPGEYLLGASRFVRYKRLDMVIEAGESTGVAVVLAGSGPDLAALRSRARESSVEVFFVEKPSSPLLYSLYRGALAFVFPAVEDFGIMPVEAMAAGVPVIARRDGGAAESVRLVQGGAILQERSKAGWRHALNEALGVNTATLPARTARFSSSRFRREIHDWLVEQQVHG